jgi:hypothetical protein
MITNFTYGRSEWPRCLRHEISWHAQILRWWARIPLEVWTFFCLCYSVKVAILRRLIPRPRSPTFYTIHGFRINSEREQARQPNPSSRNKKNFSYETFRQLDGYELIRKRSFYVLCIKMAQKSIKERVA